MFVKFLKSLVVPTLISFSAVAVFAWFVSVVVFFGPHTPIHTDKYYGPHDVPVDTPSIVFFILAMIFFAVAYKGRKGK